MINLEYKDDSEWPDVNGTILDWSCDKNKKSTNFVKLLTKSYVMQDLIDRLLSYKTTIIGVVTAIASMLVLFGVVGKENQEGVVEGISNFWEALIAVLASINGLILIFSKDSDKS